MCWLADNGLAVAEHKTEAHKQQEDCGEGNYTSRINSNRNNQVSWSTDRPQAIVSATPIVSSSQSIQIDCSHLKDDGQYSRTKAAQHTDHSHSGDIYYTVRRAHMGRSYEDRIIQPPVQSCLQTLCITSSFCTVSEEATLVVAGTIPIDLLAAERRTGSTASNTTIETWQRRWNKATTGRWTHKLTPSLTPRLQRRHG